MNDGLQEFSRTTPIQLFSESNFSIGEISRGEQVETNGLKRSKLSQGKCCAEAYTMVSGFRAYGAKTGDESDESAAREKRPT
jgi:hypothetical protein